MSQLLLDHLYVWACNTFQFIHARLLSLSLESAVLYLTMLHLFQVLTPTHPSFLSMQSTKTKKNVGSKNEALSCNMH